MTPKDEEEWFIKFKQGTFIVKGWDDRVKEILQIVPPLNKKEIQGYLLRLGDKIGREWAKHNASRRIDTAMIRMWGEELRLAAKKGYPILFETIRAIDNQVNKILL